MGLALLTKAFEMGDLFVLSSQPRCLFLYQKCQYLEPHLGNDLPCMIEEITWLISIGISEVPRFLARDWALILTP